MSDHDDLREFLASQSPAWLADRFVRAAGHDRVLLAELESAASGRDGAEAVRRELDRAIFVSGFVDEEEVGTYVAGVDRALEMLAALIESGQAAQAAELAQHSLRLMHESAESVNMNTNWRHAPDSLRNCTARRAWPPMLIVVRSPNGCSIPRSTMTTDCSRTPSPTTRQCWASPECGGCTSSSMPRWRSASVIRCCGWPNRPQGR